MLRSQETVLEKVSNKVDLGDALNDVEIVVMAQLAWHIFCSNQPIQTEYPVLILLAWAKSTDEVMKKKSL